MNRMDRTAAWIKPGDIPAALRLLSVMEEFGEIRRREAAEWTLRIAARGR